MGGEGNTPRLTGDNDMTARNEPISRADAIAAAAVVYPHMRRAGVALTVDAGIHASRQIAYAFVSSANRCVRVTRCSDGSLAALEW